MRQRQTLGTLGVIRAIGGSVAIALAVSSGVVAAAEEDQDYHRRALQAFTEARYEQALQLFSLGYAETKQPELLIRIGQTYLKLGRNAEALQACESYVTRVENPSPLYKGYAEQCITEAKRPAAYRPPTAGRSLPPPVVESPQALPPPPLPAAVPSTTSGLPSLPGDPVTPPPVTASRPAATPTPTPDVGPAAPAPTSVTTTTTSAVPPPINLTTSYDRCLQYQRDGRTDAARSCYLEFLPSALRVSGIPDGSVGSLMAQLQRYPEPSSAFPPLLRHHEERRNTGLWAAGLTLWLSAMVPAVAMANTYYMDIDPTHKNIYYTMMAPVVGPFIAGIWLPLNSPPGDTRNNTVINFTVPWIVADGLSQLVGFCMFVGGVQTRRLPIPPSVERVLSRTRIAPYGDASGGGMAAMGRF